MFELNFLNILKKYFLFFFINISKFNSGKGFDKMSYLVYDIRNFRRKYKERSSEVAFVTET